jgi:predicted Zn-dependent protease
MKSFFKERRCLSARELQRYARHELAPDQVHDVEAHLLDCPLCAAATEGYTEHSFSEADEAALEELGQMHFPVRRRPLPRVWMNRAAAILLILAGAYALWQYQAATRHQTVFAAFYEPVQPAYLNLRGTVVSPGSSSKPELKTALQLYENEDFEASIVFLEQHLNAYPEDDQARLLMASALLGNWQPERAIHILHQLESDNVETEDLYWLLVLAHIQNDELDVASQLLSQTAFQGARAEKAARLEAELEP